MVSLTVGLPDAKFASGLALPSVGRTAVRRVDRVRDRSDAVELVLFDLDGTLIDHDCAVATAVETWLLENGWAAVSRLSR